MNKMTELKYALLSDGSSERALRPILTWLLRQYTNCAIQDEWADLRRLPNPPSKLSDRVKLAIKLYPCDLLFVHRDAENQEYNLRVTEIRKAIAELGELMKVPFVCVVPVRMTEAWLLFDEAAIRKAAGNPNGKQQLRIPPANKLEELSNPKEILYELLRNASELSGRRLKKFNVHRAIHRITELIDDFSPLNELSAFRALKEEILSIVEIFRPCQQ